MNESLLIGQLILLVALVPCVYTANFYYKAYHELREKHKKVNGTLVLDKFLFVTELHGLVEDWQDLYDVPFEKGTPEYAVRQCRLGLQAVLEGNGRRLKEARKRVEG